MIYSTTDVNFPSGETSRDFHIIGLFQHKTKVPVDGEGVEPSAKFSIPMCFRPTSSAPRA